MRSQRRLMGSRLMVPLFVTTALCACSQSTLLPLPPLPDLESLNSAPREQLRQRHATVATLLRTGTTESEQLGYAFGQLGEIFHAYMDVKSAQICYVNANALQPDVFRWAYLLGQAERTLGNHDAAASVFERALAVRPDDVPTLVWLAEIDLEQHRLTSARRRFHQALAADPGCVKAHFGLGLVALEDDDYARSIGHLEKALAAQPGASPILYSLALAYRGLRDMERAATLFEQSKEPRTPISFEDPLLAEVGNLRESANVYVRRGMRAANRGYFTAATQEFERALAANPDRTATRYNFAGALLKLGRRREALGQLQELIERAPRYSRGRVLLAKALADDGDVVRAEEHLRRAADFDPDSGHVHLALGNLLRNNGRLEEALTSYRRAQQLDPGAGAARFGVSITLVQLSRYEEALTTTEASVRALPDNRELKTVLARLLAAAPMDSLRNGMRALQLATATGHHTVTLAETRAMVLAELGRFDEAARWQLAALEGAPNSEGVSEWVPRRLSLYRREAACRRPWEPGERISSLRIKGVDQIDDRPYVPSG